MSDGRLHLSFDAFHDGDAGVWVARVPRAESQPRHPPAMPWWSA